MELAGKIKQSLVNEAEASVTKKVQEEVNVQVNKVYENLAWASLTVLAFSFCFFSHDHILRTSIKWLLCMTKTGYGNV